MTTNEMPSRKSASESSSNPPPLPGGDDRVAMSDSTLERLSPGLVSASPDEQYRPPSVRPRSILGDDALLVPTTPAHDPNAAERIAQDTRIYRPRTANTSAPNDDDEYARLFADHTTPTYDDGSPPDEPAEAPVWGVPGGLEPTPAAPTFEERDYGRDGFEPTEAEVSDGERIAAERDGFDSTKQKATTREGKRLSKKEQRQHRARLAAEAKVASEREEREKTNERNSREAEESRRQSLAQHQKVLARNARDAAKARQKEQRQAEKARAKEAKRGARKSAPVVEATAAGVHTDKGTPFLSQATQPRIDDADGLSDRQKTRAAKRAARTLKAVTASQAKVDRRRRKESDAQAAAQAKGQAKRDEALLVAQTRKAQGDARDVRKQREREEKAKAKADKADSRGKSTRSVSRGKSVADVPEGGGGTSVPPFVPEAPSAIVPPRSRTHFKPGFPRPTPAPISAPDADSLTRGVFTPGLNIALEQLLADTAATRPAPLETNEVTDSKSEPTVTTPPAKGSRRERRLALSTPKSSKEDTKALSDAEHAHLLRAAHESIQSAQIDEAKGRYDLTMESITAAGKRREIEMDKEHITLADKERKRLNKRALVAALVAAGIGLMGGLAAGALFSDTLDELSPFGEADVVAVGPIEVAQITGPDGELVRVLRSYESEDCGTALLLGVIGSSSAGSEFPLSSLTYTVQGQPMTPAESTDACYADSTAYSGVAGTYVVYLDGQVDELITSASVALGDKVNTWTATDAASGAVPGEELSGDQPDEG